MSSAYSQPLQRAASSGGLANIAQKSQYQTRSSSSLTSLADHDEDDEWDQEQAQSVPSLVSLSSAEQQFDQLLHSIHYRQRASFARYVRKQVAEWEGMDDVMSSSTSGGAAARKAYANGTSNGVMSLPREILRSFPFLSFLATPWFQVILQRFYLLSGLLVLQSCSSLILAAFSKFIAKHVVVTLYLTMLVGAGGNAGNQSAVLVIRMLATGTGSSGGGDGVSNGGSPSKGSNRSTSPSLSLSSSTLRLLWGEFRAAIFLGAMMFVVGFLRVWAFEGGGSSGDSGIHAALAITMSLYVIVTLSIILGAALPLAIHALGYDPAHAGPIIQVVMDILGVAITCAICSLMLG